MLKKTNSSLDKKELVRTRILLSFSILFFMQSLFSQVPNGPGGVGNNQGTSSLKLWFRPDFGLSTSSGLISNWQNAAGLSALDISETGSQRPTLVSGVVNGFDEISFSGSNRLRTGLTLTTTNFIVNQASAFTVCRADNTTQSSCVYTTDPLEGSTRFSNHIPWSGSVYYDIGTCCSNDARIEVGGLLNLNTYSIWTYDALSTDGKQLYRNGSLLQNRANTSTYSSHATHRFNIGGNTSGTSGFVGDVTEIIIFNSKINSVQRKIIDNYLAAKYGLTLSANDLYTMDNPSDGNFDYDVAGIGRDDASNIHNDAQGTGIVRFLNPSGLGNGEYFIWGHNNLTAQATNTTDVPTGVTARFARVWRSSEVGDVGNLDVRFDLTGLGMVTTSDLRLLIDTDNDGVFSDETPISGATAIGSNVYEFSGVSDFSNNRRFTIGTINTTQTPLPIELLNFDVVYNNFTKQVDVTWHTATEINNAYFTIERSVDGQSWEYVKQITGAGNSSSILSYASNDETPYNGLSYYRLKQTDLDGRFTYSLIRDVLINNEGSINVYPIPFDDDLIIALENSSSTIEIINSLGQIVLSLNTKGEGIINLNTNLIQAGIYTLRVTNSSNVVYKQILKN